jgi:osmotically-inducible protein OsmY
MEQRDSFFYIAVIMLGTAVGGTLGGLLFSSLIPNLTKGTITGVVVGAVLGILIASCALYLEKRWHDQELRTDAEDSLRSADVPRSISLGVKEGRVILTGEVSDPNERSRAEEALTTVPGIAAVENRISVEPQPATSSAADIRRKVRDNLVHLAASDAEGIRVLVDRTRVVLEGKVRSWPAASLAEEIAWRIPGVESVDNCLDIEDIAA